MIKPLFYILSGEGINCEHETLHALEQAGAQGKIIHINDLIKNKESLKSIQGLLLPGGFSYGDELGSGQILALKMKRGLYQELIDCVDRGVAIGGICNGFQVLVRLGLIPDHQESRSVSLIHNKDHKFIDKWARLKREESVCWWTHQISKNTLSMPIRHGEGKIFIKDEKVFHELEKNKQIVFRYQEDVNGSLSKIAGLCNKRGNVFGLMPHPEAALYKFQKFDQDKSREFYDGYKVFESIVYYLKNN